MSGSSLNTFYWAKHHSSWWVETWYFFLLFQISRDDFFPCPIIIDEVMQLDHPKYGTISDIFVVYFLSLYFILRLLPYGIHRSYSIKPPQQYEWPVVCSSNRGLPHFTTGYHSKVRYIKSISQMTGQRTTQCSHWTARTINKSVYSINIWTLLHSQ